MGNDRCSTDRQHTLDVSYAGAIMGELNNLFMGSRQICVIKVVELKAFTAKPAEKALHPRSCFAIFNDIVRTVAVVASYFDRSHKSKSMDSIKIVLSTHLNLHLPSLCQE